MGAALKLDESGADPLNRLQQTGADEQACQSFFMFCFWAWSQVNPGRRLVLGWHLEIVADEVQDFTRPLWDPECPPRAPGENEMAICVPPRSLKSYMLAICLPAWLWLHAPWLMFQGISNDDTLAGEHSRAMLELMQTPWFQRLIVHMCHCHGKDPELYAWGFSKKQLEKTNFENTEKGKRIALGVDARITGKGADLQLVDDPYDAKEATRGSPELVERRMKARVTDYDTVWATRLNNPDWSLRLLIMQRLDENDLAGELIRRGVRCVVLPMEFDPDFPKELGGVHPRDPRTEPGELLMEDHWSRAWWEKAKSIPGALRALMAQYCQRPTAKSGGLFNPAQFVHRYTENPYQAAASCDRQILVVDCSFKDTPGSSHVVIQNLGKRNTTEILLLDQVRAQMGFLATCQQLALAVKKWPFVEAVYVEDKANGPAVIEVMETHLDIPVIPYDPGTKSKWERAEVSTYPQLVAGNYLIPTEEHAPWIDGYVKRHVKFDGKSTTPDDEVDATSMGIRILTEDESDPMDEVRAQVAELEGLL